MTLRSRLSLAFVFVVMVPVLVGSLVVLIAVPRILRDQIGDRLRTASVNVTDVLAARCTEANQAAQILGLEVAALGPAAAVKQMVTAGTVDYAVVAGANSTVVASAGRLPNGTTPTPLPDVLNSCGDRTNAGIAISSRATLDLAATPALKSVAVAWAVGATTASTLRAGLVGQPAITLLVDGATVSSTLSTTQAGKQATAARNANAQSVSITGGRILAFAAPSAGEPYGVVVSSPVPNTTRLTWALLGIVVLMVLVGLIMGRLLARLISKPVVELSEAAARAASGDLDIAIPVRTKDEVGRLAGAFNHMTFELQTYIRQLERSRDELRQNLDRLGATLTHTHDLGGILAVVLDTAIGSVHATGGAIMFLDAGGKLTVRVRRGEAADAAPADAVLALGEGITGRVASTGEAVRGTVGEGPGLRPMAGEPVAKTVIAVPLRQSGRIVGVLNLYDKEAGRAFSAHDLESTLAFASQASVAIDNVLLHQEAQRLSLTDPLTALWNYRYLTIGLGHEIERATRFTRPLAALMLDLDRFKAINDEHGHQVGDAVLIELAGRMRAEVREVDTVARYGGEEFVIVLPETDSAGAARLADRLGTVIRSNPFCAGAGVRNSRGLDVTASIGVAVFPEHGETPSRLLRSADEALYAAKNGGRDQWRFATPDLSSVDLVKLPKADHEPVAGPPGAGTQLSGAHVVVMPDVKSARSEEVDRPRTPDA